MSEATVQFVELVRLASAQISANADYQRLHYCDCCNATTLHAIKAHGLHETFVCMACGRPKTYTVR